MKSKIENLFESVRQRFEVIESIVSFSTCQSNWLTFEDIIEDLLASIQLTVSQKSALLHFGFTSTYPLDGEVRAIAQFIELSDVCLLKQRILGNCLKLPRHVLCRKIVTIENILIDVTRLSHEYVITGIPQVQISAFAACDKTNSTFVKWSHGAFVVDNCFSLSKIRSHSVHVSRLPGGSLFMVLKKIYRFLGNRRIRVPSPWAEEFERIYFYIKSFVGKKSDAVVFLLSNNILETEVCSRQICKRFVPWLKYFPCNSLTLVLHDLLPITSPQMFRGSQSLDHIHYLSLLAEAKTIICGHLFLAQHAEKICLFLDSGDLPCFKVIAFPVAPNKIARQAYKLTKAPKGLTVCVVGVSSERKNISSLIFSLKHLSLQGVACFVNVYGCTSEQKKRALDLMCELCLPLDLISFYGYVSDSQLAEGVKSSDVMAYLSRCEGFGLPVYEALANNVPVVASSIPSNIEIASKCPGVFIVDSNSPKDIALNILKAARLKSSFVSRLSLEDPFDNEILFSQKVLDCASGGFLEDEEMC